MPDFTKKVAEEIEGAEYHLMYDVGHLGNLESPIEFNRLITQFISRYRDPRQFCRGSKDINLLENGEFISTALEFRDSLHCLSAITRIWPIGA